jgi:hypothetical protein
LGAAGRQACGGDVEGLTIGLTVSLEGSQPMLSREHLIEKAAAWMPRGWAGAQMRIHTDASDFFAVGYGDILQLGSHAYLIRNSAREGRFGLEDEVKHWVKRAIALESGEMCIVKLLYYEKFTTQIGGITFECFRSARKEARILDLVHEHPNFMHGVTLPDEKGNPVRILEVISGRTLADHITDRTQDHETYFYETLPGIIDKFLECIEAVRFLHDHREKHGDIRRDHILVDSHSGRYRWIDFDYNYRHRENIYGYDLFGLGNILAFIIGKGDVRLGDLKQKTPELLERLTEADLNIVFRNRVVNLKKIYPYIPTSLNQILLHFSRGTHWFYEHTGQLINDLESVRAEMGWRGVKGA